ncbi:MAG: sugar ABC transporter permease [Ruthenibacterium sp.]
MKTRRKLFILSFLAPALLCLLGIFLYPAVRTAMMSFCDVSFVTDPTSAWSWVGMKNYMHLFTSRLFQRALWNVVQIWLVEGAIVLALAMIFAVIITSGVKGKNFWRAILYLPNVISTVALATMWLQYVFNNQYGFFKTLFEWLHWEAMAAFQWTAPENLFLSMMIAFAFGTTGFYVLILVAGIDGIPEDYYEAATIEGAGAIRKMFYITLPLLKDIIKRCIVLWSAGAIGFFVYSSLFSFNTELATVTPIVYLYDIVFGKAAGATSQELNAGGGAAVGVVVMGLVLGINGLLDLLIRTEDQKPCTIKRGNHKRVHTQNTQGRNAV